MKKLLALVCAIAVFVSSISGALVLTSATTGSAPTPSTAVLPVIKDSVTGNKIKLYPDTDITALDCCSAVHIVKNTSNLPLTSLYSVYAETNRVSFEAVKISDYKGAFFYVETPDISSVSNGTYTTNQFRFAVQFEGYNESTPDTTKYVYASYTDGAATWYSMPLGDSVWTEEKTYNTGIELEYGFKGYVYMPFDTTAFNNSSAKFDADTYITTLRIRNLTNDNEVFSGSDKAHKAKATEENPLVYSYPIFVEEVGADNKPTTDSLIIDGNTVYLDARLVPATVDLAVTKATASSTGTTDGTNSTNTDGRGVRKLLGAQSALTRSLGTTMLYHRLNMASSTEIENGTVYAAGRSYFENVTFSSVSSGGIIFHVDIPKLDSAQTVKVRMYDGTTGRSMDKALGGTSYDTWYMLPDNTDSWIEKGSSDWLDNYSLILGDGTAAFSGYVYVPGNTVNNWGSGLVNVSEIRIDVTPWRYTNEAHGNKTPLENPINVSSVSIVSNFNKDTTLAYADTGALVDLKSGEVVKTDDTSAKAFYGYNTVNDTKTYLTGKAATFKSIPFEAMPEGNNKHIQAYDTTGTISYVPSISPLSEMASFKCSSTQGPSRKLSFSYEINNNLVDGTTGFMAYIEATGKLSLGFIYGFKLAGENSYPNYNGGIKLLADGATAWTDAAANTPVSNVSQLPENFKGYIYIPYPSTMADGDKIFRIIFAVATEVENTPYNLYLGNPMLVNFTEENAGLIKYNGAAEAQNMFSGEYYVPVDAETEINQVNYDYSDYKIMNVVKVAKDLTGFTVGGTVDVISPVEGATVNAVESKLAITDYPTFEMSRGDTAGNVCYYYNTVDGLTGATAALFYVELPEGQTANFSASLNFTTAAGSSYTNTNYGTTLIMANGTEAWVSKSASGSGIELPAGFKGLVLTQYSNLTLSSSKPVDATSTLYQVRGAFNNLAANQTAYMSAPILVDEITGETENWYAFVNGVTNKAEHIVTGAVLVPEESTTSSDDSSSDDSSSNESSSNESSSDESSSDTSSTTPPSEEPDYDLPNYTGTAPDYTGYSVSDLWVAKLNSEVFVGYPLDEAAGSFSGGTGEAISSITKITNYPSFKVKVGGAGDVTTGYNPKDALASGATSALYYVELPAGKSATVSFRLNFKKEGENSRFGNNHGRKTYYMAEGTNEWVEVKADGYNAALPAGFKGYVRQDYKNLTVEVDETWTLYFASVIVGGLAANDEFKISAPILMDKTSEAHSVVAAFINNDVAARDIFTGDFVLPDDARLGIKRIPKPDEEPDYDLPKYTGTAPDYTGYNLSEIWVAKLNSEVFVGYPLDEAAGSLEGATADAMKSITKISDYPSLKVKVLGDENVTVRYSPKTEYAKGATAALYYVELPAGKSANVSFRLNFEKEGENNAYGNNYSRPIYIMAEGTTKWVETATDSYFASLPAGFKGYIRQDYNKLTTPSDRTIDEAYTLYEASLIVNGLSANDEFKISAPILMDKVTVAHITTAAFVNGDVAARNLFTGAFVLPGDKSLGDKKEPIPEGPVNYDLPNYTGAKPDYTGYNISNAWVAKPNGDVYIGYPMTEQAGTINGGSFEAIKSITKLSNFPSLKVTLNDESASLSFNTKEEFSSGANSALYYVEAPAGESLKISFRLNFSKEGEKNAYGNNYSRPVYILADGTDEWVEVATTEYFATLPAGFKGYVRQDYNKLTTPSDRTIDETYTLYGASVIVKGIDEGKSFNISAPILVDKITIAHVVTAVFVNGDVAARNLFTGAFVLPGASELGEKREPIPEGPVNYDLPKYTGEKVDYSGYRVSNVWVAKLNGDVYIGYPMTEQAGAVTGGSSKAINSIVNISKYPSFSIIGNGDDNATLTFNTKAEYSSGANAALYYVEVPENQSIKISFRLNFSKDGEKSKYGNNYSRPIYIMSEDDKNWKSVETDKYFATLPAGFKGYIRQDYKDLSSISDVVIDETWTLYYAGLIVDGLSEGKTIKVSAPILIDKISSEHLPNAAYIEHDTGAARELFTGEFVKPGDAIIGGPTIEPDYKLPHYTGNAIDYGKLDIMNVRTAKLNGSIIVGRDLSEDVFVAKYGNTKAINSLVGISKYPMLSQTGMEIPAGERITVHQGNYDADANRGAKSAMFYVKIPEGQDSNFTLSWSFKHKDGRTTGAYNYSGDAYIMAKGETKWEYKPLDKYWVDLPAGFEGYIRVDFKDVWCVYAYNEDGSYAYELDKDGNPKVDENGSKVWKEDANHYYLDENWGLQTTYICISNPTDQKKIDAIVSSPILIDEFIPLQTIQNIAYVDGDTKAARNIFTGEFVKLGDFDATAGAEPDYDIPFYTGRAENYDNLSIMKTRTGRLNYAVIIGEEFSNRALVPQADTVAMPVKSLFPLSNYPTIEAYRPGGSTREDSALVYMATDAKKNAGADEIMFYIKAPATKETAIRFSWNFTNVKDGRVTGGFNYSGSASLMDKKATEWSYVNVDKYFINIPAGFEGYVRINISRIWCVYSYDKAGNIVWNNNDDGTRSPSSEGDHNYYIPACAQNEKGAAAYLYYHRIAEQQRDKSDWGQQNLLRFLNEEATERRDEYIAKCEFGVPLVDGLAGWYGDGENNRDTFLKIMWNGTTPASAVDQMKPLLNDSLRRTVG